MNNQNRNKFSWVIGLLIVILAGSMVLQFVYKQTSNQKDQSSDLKALDTKVTPPHIPNDFPGLSNQSVSYNYALQTGAKSEQGVRSFTSDKSLAESIKPYDEYFKKNGWTMVTTVDEKKLKLISAYKDTTRIQVSVTPGPNDKGSQIEITAYSK